jgi:organic hydroperoxide reductase OsmC/OhrA
MHSYLATVTWAGNTGSGYRAYTRDHEIAGDGKPAIAASSDPAFRGDATRWNPEELLVASLAQCHMLWFLHLAAMAGIVVTGYVDRATGTMSEHPDGSGEFTGVTLHPDVTVLDPARIEQVEQLHHRAHAMCFIARSVNFPVTTAPTTTTSNPSQTRILKSDLQ